MASQQKHTYTLEYFSFPKGRAERVRLTMAAAGVKWDEVANNKFADYKKAGNVLPWGHFPLLRVVDQQLNLSNTIALQWYISAEEAPHLIPRDALNQHKALSTALTTEDRFATLVKWAFAPAETKDTLRNDGTQEAARHVADLSRQLEKQEFFGATFSFADLTVWDWIDQSGQAFGTEKEVEKYDNLRQWRERVRQQKGVEEYLKGRK